MHIAHPARFGVWNINNPLTIIGWRLVIFVSISTLFSHKQHSGVDYNDSIIVRHPYKRCQYTSCLCDNQLAFINGF